MISRICFLGVIAVAGMAVVKSSTEFMRDDINCTAGKKFVVDGIKYECYQNKRIKGYRPIGVML